MNITFNDLRDIKHKLPTGSITRIAKKLNISEQTVRNYFGATKYDEGEPTGLHIEPGPGGGIVHLDDDTILQAAQDILAELQ
jgi:transposase